VNKPATVPVNEGLEVDDFDPRKVRWDFPILQQTVHEDKPLAYLDNAATTQKPVDVIDAIEEYYESYNANVHRAIHVLGEQATVAYEQARRRLADFIHAPTEVGIIFTRNTTESINLVAHGWGRRTLTEGDEIILSVMEHHSNLIPWQLLARATGARLKFVPMLEDGTLDLEEYQALLNPRVKLVAMTHMSNILGTVNPIDQMIAWAHDAGALFLVDGAQSVPHFPVDVESLDCDFLAFSGHKMCGPTGIGVLYGKQSLLEEMDPFLGGGEMIHKVTLETATWAELPQKFEAGTPNIAGAIGLGAACEYLSRIGLPAIHRHEMEITRYALDRLEEIPGLTVCGHAPDRGGVISFLMEGIHPHDVSQLVDREGVAIRAGHGCAQPLMRLLGVPAVSRASFYLYTIKDDIDQLVAALHKAQEFFNHGL
jgi:cysteine desulfurase/selenocysteine lyase